MYIQEIDATIARAVKASITRHLWYLTEPLVVFALFDPESELKVKEEMAAALLQTPRPAKFRMGKPPFPRLNDNTKLQKLIGHSWLVFDLLDSEGDWLHLPPDQWDQSQEFKLMANIVRNIAVVNDAAERGIKDIQEYANAAQDGSCRERIVLVTSSHRRKLPSFLKNEMEENM